MQNKKVGLDIDGDGKPDLNLDLKTVILIIGGLISLIMTYTTLERQIEINKADIIIAKELPPQPSHDLIDQKMLFLEGHIIKMQKELDELEDKVYKR